MRLMIEYNIRGKMQQEEVSVPDKPPVK